MNINAQTIKLPTPDKTGGMPVNQALAKRHSTREFDSTRAISPQLVSNLLWAACGINRPDDKLRTNPTARNLQEIDLYWFDKNGVYFYDFEHHALNKVTDGDYRKLIAGTKDFSQDFVLEAPGIALFVIDTTKIGEGDRWENMAYIDAGIACENLNLFCAGNGLATVPRATMDIEAIRKVLSLPATSIPAINNPVGYAK